MSKYIPRDYFTDRELKDYKKDLIISSFLSDNGNTYYKIYHKVLDRNITDKHYPRVAVSKDDLKKLIKYRMYLEKRKTYPEIKNCPFCDSQPSFYSIIVPDESVISKKEITKQHTIQCLNPNCFVHGPMSDTELNAIEKWNHRIIPSVKENVGKPIKPATPTFAGYKDFFVATERQSDDDFEEGTI